MNLFFNLSLQTNRKLYKKKEKLKLKLKSNPNTNSLLEWCPIAFWIAVFIGETERKEVYKYSESEQSPNCSNLAVVHG